MIVWTLRHPPIDRSGRCVGQTAVPLTMDLDEAVRSAVDTAPFVPLRVLSSDQPRCANLAHGIAGAWGVPVALSPRLREMSFGEWEGMAYDDIDRLDGARWRAWCDDWKRASPPSGESLPVFAARIRRWALDEPPDERTVVVTHAGVIRALRVMAGVSWDDAMAESHPYLGWMEHRLQP
ncbi:MAG: histidine phosphatase family protein [Myxococcota bacterium]|nr:histidine phosphatase family protein [Myxococcota bacterium]